MLKILEKILLLLLMTVNADQRTISDNGTVYQFWQLTDIHWDIQYSVDGNILKMCHNESDSDIKGISPYGSHFCDSPWPLVNATLHSMKKFEAKPKFILWTGDNAPHTGKAVTFPIIYKTIDNVTNELLLLFGKEIAIIPVLGNHEASPESYYPTTSQKFYGKYLNEGGWNKIIPIDAHKDFKTGGYFKYNISPKLSVLVLNTNLYLPNNKLGKKSKDPSNQFQWMRIQFQEAMRTKSKMFVTAHAPPGHFERNPDHFFLNQTYNDLYVDLLNEFGSVIVAQIYGHLHTDTFRIFGTSRDNLTSVAFLAPSVSPLRIAGAGINPSIRLYNYNLSNVLDYTQYHLNLTRANNVRDTCNSSLSEENFECVKPQFKEYYKATEFFGIDVLDIGGMTKAYEKLSLNDSLFQQYFAINTGGYDPKYCNATCKRNFLCSIVHLKTPSLFKCLNYSLDQSSDPHVYYNEHRGTLKDNKEVIGSRTNVSFIHLTNLDKNETINYSSRSFMAITVSVTAITSVIVFFLALVALVFSYKSKNIHSSSVSSARWSRPSHPSDGYQPLNLEAD